MNYRLTNCIFLTLTLTVLASAQGAKPGGGGTGASPGSVGSRGPTTGTSSAPQPGVNNIPNPNDATFGQRAFISGKVVLDDGSQLTESAAIQTLCRGHRQTVARTDSHGGFMFEFGDRASAQPRPIHPSILPTLSAPTSVTGVSASCGRTFPALTPKWST
jgi:hypothetical protein